MGPAAQAWQSEFRKLCRRSETEKPAHPCPRPPAPDPSPSQQAHKAFIVLPLVVVGDAGLWTNSVPRTTSVWASSPLAWKSARRAIIAWSRTAACRGVPSKLSEWLPRPPRVTSAKRYARHGAFSYENFGF